RAPRASLSVHQLRDGAARPRGGARKAARAGRGDRAGPARARRFLIAPYGERKPAFLCAILCGAPMSEQRRYFHEIPLGEEDEYPGRTVAEFMKQSIFGERIAHGLLCLAIQSGLFNRAATEYATLGLAGLRWKFKAPVKIGDTIRLRAKVAAKKDLDKPDRGLVTIERTIVNQRDEVVQQGETDLIVEKRR